MIIFNLIFVTLNFVEHGYYDWGFSLIKGATTETMTERVTGQIIHLIFGGSLGIIFAYLYTNLNPRYHLFKGWLFGIAVWFAVYVLVNLYNFAPLQNIPFSQMAADFITASLYGIILAYTYHRFLINTENEVE